MIRLYTLAADGETPIPCEDPNVWARWFERTNREWAGARLPNGMTVSVVFIGCEFATPEMKEPGLIWECVLKSADGTNSYIRCASKGEAFGYLQEHLRNAEEEFE